MAISWTFTQVRSAGKLYYTTGIARFPLALWTAGLVEGVRQKAPDRPLGDLSSVSAYVMGCAVRASRWHSGWRTAHGAGDIVGDAGLILGWEWSLEEGWRQTYQSILTPSWNPMGRESWWATVRGLQRVGKWLKQLSTDAPTRPKLRLTDASHGSTDTHGCCFDQCLLILLVPSWCLLFWYHFKI